jgi:hypothetical protein
MTELISHSADSLDRASRRIFYAAFELVRERCAGVVVVVVDAAERVHYHTSRNPTMTAGMMASVDLGAGTPVFLDDHPLDLVAGEAFAAGAKVADEHGVGFVLIVLGDEDRIRYRSSVGKVLTAGMLRRAANLFDITSMLPTFVPFAAVSGGIGGVAGGGPQPPATTGTGGNTLTRDELAGQTSTPAPDAPAESTPAPSDERPN